MRILVLGGTGMIGHHLLQQWQPRHDVRVTVRDPLSAYKAYGFLTQRNVYPNIDVRDERRLRAVLHIFRPEVIVNAVGIVKQVITPAVAERANEVNAHFPHTLASMAVEVDARVIQLSTDCVFQGTKGMYTEGDRTDAVDVYGITKASGELVGVPRCLTIRKSVIGEELSTANGLLEWFLRAKGHVNGYTKAVYSGLSVLEFARILERIIVELPDASGLYHLSSDPITKYDLLCLMKDAFEHTVEIVPDDHHGICDRSMDSTKLRTELGYAPPSWTSMMQELAAVSQQRR